MNNNCTYTEFRKIFNKFYPVKYEFKCCCNDRPLSYFNDTIKLKGIMQLVACAKCGCSLKYTGYFKLTNN